MTTKPVDRMEVWMPRGRVTNSTACGAATEASPDPGILYHYSHMTSTDKGRVPYSQRPPADDGRVLYGQRGEYDPGRQQGAVCQESERRDAANSLGQPQYPAIAPIPTLTGATPSPHWYYLTTPDSGTLLKRSQHSDTPTTPSGTKAETAALGGPPTPSAAETTTASSTAPLGKGSWVGPTGPRRSRRRYQLWRESRQFLDTCYYHDRRGHVGVKLPYCAQGASQLPPPPLLPLLDVPEGRSSSSGSKPPPPLLPLSDAATSQPPLPPPNLYPSQLDAEPPPLHSLPLPETTAASRVKTQQENSRSYLQHHHSLPEISSSLPPHPHHHQPYCQYHRHLTLHDYATYPHHHPYHLPLPTTGADTRLRLRYPVPPPPCPHRRQEALGGLSQAMIRLPQPIGAPDTLRDQQIMAAAYLRNLYQP